jgi:hypothetical protein
VRFGDKLVITAEEHSRIAEREKNPERRAFYQLAWHLGASQSDLAHLQAEAVDWQTRVICYERIKLNGRGQPAQIRFGKEIEEILKDLPSTGPLFPYLITVRPGEQGENTGLPSKIRRHILLWNKHAPATALLQGLAGSAGSGGGPLSGQEPAALFPCRCRLCQLGTL